MLLDRLCTLQFAIVTSPAPSFSSFTPDLISSFTVPALFSSLVCDPGVKYKVSTISTSPLIWGLQQDCSVVAPWHFETENSLLGSEVLLTVGLLSIFQASGH